MKRHLILVGLVGVCLVFGGMVVQKEAVLEEGHLVLLALAPVDPRSLMQGDYMTLRYAVAVTVRDALSKTNSSGMCERAVSPGPHFTAGTPARSAMSLMVADPTADSVPTAARQAWTKG